MDRDKRMKSYEQQICPHIPAKSFTIIRVDGRAFHTYTRDMKFAKPFDSYFMEQMDKSAEALCAEIQGAQFAYVQSDEISVLVTDFGSNAQQWFGGDAFKMVSISASIATGVMNNSNDGTDPTAHFDSRVFTVPTRAEAINYFLWRQADCYRNAIQMMAQDRFTHRELHGKNILQQTAMLTEASVYIWEAYTEDTRQGRLVTKKTVKQEITYTHKKTSEVKTTVADRSFWQAASAPWFDWDERGFLELNVPLRDGDDEAFESDEPDEGAGQLSAGDQD